MKKGVNKIENQGENWYKLLQKCQMTDFCEKIDQLWVELSLKLNVIETNHFFLQKEKVNKMELGIKCGPNGIGKYKKTGVNRAEVSTMFKYGSALPTGYT